MEQLYLTWKFENDKFSSVEATPNVVDFHKLRDILIERYGKPTSVNIPIVHSGFGAEYQDEQYYLSGRKVSIWLWKYFGTLNRGYFRLYLVPSTEAAAAHQKKEDEARKKASEKLK